VECDLEIFIRHGRVSHRNCAELAEYAAAITDIMRDHVDNESAKRYQESIDKVVAKWSMTYTSLDLDRSTKIDDKDRDLKIAWVLASWKKFSTKKAKQIVIWL
jgi:hypothetical protein